MSGNSFGGIGCRDLSHLCPMHLPLLEETTATHPEALRKSVRGFREPRRRHPLDGNRG